MARGALRLARVIPRSGETRTAKLARSPDMQSHGEGDGLGEYLVGLVFLAIVLIVVLALAGSEVANVLNHA